MTISRPIFPVVVVFAAAVAIIAACGGEDGQQEPECDVRLSGEDGQAFETLGEFCFFGGDPADHEPNDGVVAYDVTAELYSDHSRKKRFIVLPEGERIGFHATEPWSWPDDTILIKTFYYPVDERDPQAGKQILETRLLIKRDGQWGSHVYVWNDDQSDAELHNIGRRVDVEYTDEHGDAVEIDYRIPERAQCADCHARDGETAPIGPRTDQLTEPFQRDETNPPQIEHMADLEMFDNPPSTVDDLPAMVHPGDDAHSLDDRARSYLDANCAHCHSPDARASSSNLHLEYDETDERKLGICKTPVAAGTGAGGRDYDIVPGKPDESIMIYRMESADPEIKMPELPITTVDEFGVELVRQWIEQMEPVGCP